jgi:hypothetical protein
VFVAVSDPALRQWRDYDYDYDYDVLEDGVVLGHIFFLDAVGQQGRPWMWASGHKWSDTPRSPRLRADARGRDGGVCEDLTRGVADRWR